MKKTIVIGALILGTAFVGMPYIMGVVAEKATYKLVDNINKDADIYGKTEITHYERSFSSTQASYKVTLPSSLNDLDLSFKNIEYECDASHGLINYSYICKLVSAGEYKEFVNEHLAGKDPLSMKGQVSVFGKLTQVLHLDAFKISKDNDVLDVGAASIETISDTSFNDYLIDGEFAGMSFSEGNTKSSIGKIEITGDISITEDNLQFGTISLDLSEANVKADGEMIVEDFVFEVDSQDHGDTIAFDYVIKMKKLLVNNSNSNYDLDDLSLEIKASGMDRASIVELSELFRDISKQNGELTPEQTFKALPIAEAMLRKNLAFSYDFKTDFQNETLKSNFDTRLINKVTMAELSLLALDPESALDKLTLNTSTVIPDSIIKQQPSYSYILLNNPFFQQFEGGFKSDLVFEKDNISLNGEEISLNDLISTVMQSVP